jgi:hypothetical protein
MWVISLSRKLCQNMFAVYNVILTANFKVMVTYNFNPGIVLDKFMIASVNIIVK